MALTKAERELLQEARDAALEALILIKGANGGGIVSHVSDHDDKIESLGTLVHQLRKNFWMLVGLLVGSGVIGGSLWGALG